MAESKEMEALDKLEECANGMKDLPKSNWIDLAENEAELDLKIMDWVETIKFELFEGKQALTELQQIKSAEPTKALESLEELRKETVFVNIKAGGCYDFNCYSTKLDKTIDEVCNTIKQALMSKSNAEMCWEIVKNKLVDVFKLYNCKTVEEYNQSQYRDCKLTEEEFELLKRGLE